MHPGEVAGLHYFAPSNLPSCRAHFNVSQSNIPSFNLSKLFGPYLTPQVQPMPFALVHQPTMASSNNSTSDEAKEHQQSVADERRKRRMISNRESARRSRMRKQKQLDDLWSQVLYLRAANRQLIDELNCVLEKHSHILHDSAQLRQEASVLREKLENLEIQNACAPSTALTDS